MMYNGRPVGRKKTVQFLVLLTLLAWATQTLYHQWGYGQELPVTGAAASGDDQALPQLSPEQFVPGTARFAAGATLELRAEATITGAEVRLRQVCRWADRDEAVFAPVKDLILFRLDPARPYRALNVEDLKNILHDAGVNLAVIKISGPLSCMVSRGDVHIDEHDALEQWIAARQGDDAPAHPANAVPSPATQPSVNQTLAIPAGDRALPSAAPNTNIAADASPVRSLQSLLTHDLAVRLSLPEELLQMSFNPQDQSVLSLAEPQFQFQIKAKRARNLGDVSWDVVIVAGTGPGASRKVAISATARAWQEQTVVVKPLAYKQIFRPEDVVTRRALVDHLSDSVLVSADQIIGQQAGVQLNVGTIITAPMVEAVPLVRGGQLVTVILSQGSVEVKSVARAMEPGSFGQTIRVRNEATRDIFEVVVSGPQTARMGNTTPTRVNAEPLASLKD